MKRRLISMLLVLCMVLAFLPATVSADAANMTSGNLNAASPSKEQIQAKWKEITSAESLYEEEPSASAPYKTGSLSDSFLQSGITYLNYVRYVAHLPQVQLNDSLNEDAQYGAVLLAAVDTLTHYPSQPADMDDAFYQRGASATRTSNLSARWGYNPLSCLQGAVQGCMDDNGSNNLATVGHRRWLLNPTLLNVGFGYAESSTGWSYIDTKVFDRSGDAVSYDFISWPSSGNFPTNLFNTRNPWSITLNPSKYKTPSQNEVKVTITRKSDGRVWTFDATTGSPSSNTSAYMTVENSGYGVSNCIIFHPGSANIDAYSGVFTVDVSGIYYRNGSAATLHYQVDFFDVETYGAHSHSYTKNVTAPTCTEKGYTTYTCVCGDSYVSDYSDALGHSYTGKVTTDPTATQDGVKTYTCSRCKDSYTEAIPALGEDDSGTVKTTPMYRLYNPNSGEHFYTGSQAERDNLVSVGWNYEGIAWNAPTQSGEPVYRCFNPNSGDHHYTMSKDEVDMLVSLGWKYEGVAWNSASAENVPQYRLYNPNADCGSHHYTSSTEERDYLVSLGWIFEGIGWYGMVK